MNLEPAHHDAQEARDIDSAWMLVACQREHEFVVVQQSTSDQPLARNGGNNA